MRICLYTGFNKDYAELAKLTIPRMVACAARHRIDFREFHEPPGGLSIYWTGVCRGLELFDLGYNYVIYLDADQLITTPAKFPLFGSGFHIGRDWGTDATDPLHVSACGFQCDWAAAPILQHALDLESEWSDEAFPEQAQLREALAIATSGPRAVKEGITLHPRRVYGSVPDAVAPGNVPEPWQPGDFAAHLTMVPMDRRIELAKELIAQHPWN